MNLPSTNVSPAWMDLLESNPISYCEYQYLHANGTELNITLPAVYWALIVLSPVNLFLSLLGVILNVIFICRTKTNFMVRVFVYMTVGLTVLQLFPCLSLTIPAFDPENLNQLCIYLNYAGIREIQMVLNVVVSLLVFVPSSTIIITMMVKICSHSCDRRCHCCQRHNARDISPLCKKWLEVIYVACAFGIPLILFALWFIPYGGGLIWAGLENVIFGITPLAVILSMIGCIPLLIWFGIRYKVVSRPTVIVKEMILFLSLFLVISTLGMYLVIVVYHWFFEPQVVSLTSKFSLSIAEIHLVSLTLLSPYPLCVFLYMWYSFRRPSTRRVRFAAAQEQRTGALKTTPDSTRVSAFSHTSQNYDPEMFLSPSTAGPTEDTPLLQ